MKTFIEWMIRTFLSGYHLSKNPKRKDKKEGEKHENT